MAMPKSVYAICGGLGLLIFVISMSVSYSTLSPLEAGVKMNTLSQSISDKFYSQGRHYIGPMHKFIVFPTILQTIEFSSSRKANAPPLKVASGGGQIMVLEVSFQFRLMTSNLTKLYKSYEQKYRGKFLSIAETELKNHAPRYSPTQFFQNRIQISDAMHTALNLRFKREFFAVVESFQLRKIEPPRAISMNIRDKLIQKERSALATQKKEAVKVRSKSDTIKATYEAKTVVVQAEAARDAKLHTEKALADAISIKLERKAKAYKRLKDALKFSNADFLKFLYIENIRTSKSTDKIIGNLDAAFFSQNL